jgi:glycine/D-amino acid oxidase-like deaminating enzyme
VRSFWLQQALASESRLPRPWLGGSVEADVCIVGGGFAGLWTALHLKQLEPACRVVVIEADICGGGASGRNGGFVMSWWSKVASLAKLCGRDEAIRLARASQASVDAICAFADESAPGAEVRRCGWLWTASSDPQRGAWDATLAVADGEAFESLTPEEVARLAGSPAHLEGVLERGVASVQPAVLCRALARAAEERGVMIHETSPMTRLVRGAAPVVETPHGEVRAATVVLAMNAWAARLPEIRPHLVVTSSDVVATRPMPDRLAAIGWADGPCISDSRRLVNYFRTTADGRVVFGKGGGMLARNGRIGPAFDAPSRREAVVLEHLHRLLPMFFDVAAEQSWCGPIDYTLGGMPVITRLPDAPEVIVGVGFSGNGVGPSHLVARMLASMALRTGDEWEHSPFVRTPGRRLPPEPLTWIGGNVVRRAIARRERLEDGGSGIDPVTRFVAALDPTGFVG